jgi:deazaflavin-dependent oxidoreductase (nitroreductase family)
MLLTTKGRKSQKMKVTPIGYYRIDDKITLISGWGKTANWYRNMEAYPNEVFIQIGFHREPVLPSIIGEEREILKIIKHLISQDPKGANTLLGWDPAHDHLENADFSMILERVLVIQFSPRKE